MVENTDSALKDDFHKIVLDAFPSPVFVVQQVKELKEDVKRGTLVQMQL